MVRSSEAQREVTAMRNVSDRFSRNSPLRGLAVPLESVVVLLRLMRLSRVVSRD